MTITDLLLFSFWHNDTPASIQILAVNIEQNEVTYITIESFAHAYDFTREQTTVNFDTLQETWTISDYDEARIANGESIPDPRQPPTE